MVSKIAVVALVAIVACPILIGYGLNVETVQRTDFTSNNDYTNVTPLISTGTSYHYVNADTYAMNTQEDIFGQFFYKQNTSIYTSLMLHQAYVQGTWGGNEVIVIANYRYFALSTDAQNLNANIFVNGVHTDTISNVAAAYYDAGGDGLLHVYKVTLGQTTEYTYANATNYVSYPSGSYVAGSYSVNYLLTSEYNSPSTASANSAYVDISAGFYMNHPEDMVYNFPTPASKVVMTLDLYQPHDIIFEQTGHVALKFERSVSYWTVYSWESNAWVEYAQLPLFSYNNSCYQLTLNRESWQIDYIGAMPTQMGIANSYRTFGPYLSRGGLTDDDFGFIHIEYPNTGGDDTTVSPIMRFDYALVRSTTYNMISNYTYNPITIKSLNPATKLDGVYRTGSSITFGGNTYSTSNGYLTLGSRSISLDGIIFDSVANGANYDNRINGTTISTTATPSTIAFNGAWGIVSISTSSSSAVTIEEQKWIPGHFAWQGVDRNFELVGLFTALAAFVALGMYGRRSGAKVLPLMIICGGAALMFLVMI